MDALGVQFHGVHLNLATNHAPLLAYAREHLDGLAQAPVDRPDLRITCLWSEGTWNEKANPFRASHDLNVIGKRMLGNADELIWLNTLRMNGLQLRFQREATAWHFEVAYCFHPKADKLQNLPDYQFKKYFSLMSYLVYYPLFWYLEKTRGWHTLHASALQTPRGGILIGGLGGVGKTTTCVALMQRPGITLLSENLVFTDGEFIFPCPEPIRLDAGSLAMLGDEPSGLKPMFFPEGLKDKWLFHPIAGTTHAQVTPAVLFLPQFSRQRYVQALDSDLAAEKMHAMNRLTQELDDYGWYASALDMHWPAAGQAAQRLEVLRRFARRVRCYELGIDRTAALETVVQDVLNVLE